MADKEMVEEQLHMEGFRPPQIDGEQNSATTATTAEPTLDPNQVTIDDFVGESILDSDAVQELMKEAAETEQHTKKKKSVITNLLFLAINIIFMVFIVKNLLSSAGDGNFGEIAAQQGKRMWWIAGGFGLLLVFFACEIWTYYYLIKKTTGKRKLFLSYRLASVGKYYDFITPTQVGGQPAEILRLNKAGIGAGLATSIPILKLIVYNFVYTIVAVVLFVFAGPLVNASGGQGFFIAIIKIFAIIGLISTVFSCFLYYIIGNGRIIGRSFVQGLVRLGYKLRIVKNYRQTFEKLIKQVGEYQASIKYLKKNKGTLIATALISLIEIVAFLLIPFCMVMAFSNVVLLSFSDVCYAMLITMAEYMLCQLVATVIPLPGGTGTMEICFMFLFDIGQYAVGGNIVWSLIFFRIITYYVVIIHGFIHVVAENIAKVVHARKTKRSAALKL